MYRDLGPRLALLPPWLHAEVMVEDQRLSLEAGRMLAHRGVLDLSQVVLWREWQQQVPSGRITRYGIDLDQLGQRGKPAPDMFLEAARRLGVAPPRAVVFEDATAGIAAARASGFGLVVGVGRGTQAAALMASGADQVVAYLSEVSLQSEGR